MNIKHIKSIVDKHYSYSIIDWDSYSMSYIISGYRKATILGNKAIDKICIYINEKGIDGNKWCENYQIRIKSISDITKPYNIYKTYIKKHKEKKEVKQKIKTQKCDCKMVYDIEVELCDTYVLLNGEKFYFDTYMKAFTFWLGYKIKKIDCDIVDKRQVVKKQVSVFDFLYEV